VSTLSVIIPTFNRKDYLLQALDSLRVQTRPVDEIIVWDDGSTDGTEEAIVGLKDENLQYHRAENAGKSAALNQAMRLTKGDFIWICDDDDLAVPDAAERLACILDNDPEVGISGGGYERFRDTPSGREISGPGYWPDLDKGTPLRHLLEDIFLFQNASLVRRTCYDRVGPFREDLPRSIDYDMIVRLATRYPVHMSHEVVFLQRKHDGERGPARHRHAASKVDSVWAAQDGVVFEGLRDHIPLTLIEAMFDGQDTEIRRAARLELACIYARHGKWGFALDDLEAAALIENETSLGAVEIDICRRAVSGKHGVNLSAAELKRLGRLRRSGRIGQQIVQSLGRGMLWSVRQAATHGDWAEVRKFSRFIFATGVLTRTPPGASDVRERRRISANAYEW
jgi:hypothetical protein